MTPNELQYQDFIAPNCNTAIAVIYNYIGVLHRSKLENDTAAAKKKETIE